MIGLQQDPVGWIRSGMKSFIKWYGEQDAGSFSFVALLLIAGAQIFTVVLFREASVKTYLEKHPSYIADIEFERMQPGRGGRALYRLQYQIDEGGTSVKCDVLVNYSNGPYFENRIRVTPKGKDCSDPYLTDFEYRPVFHALCGACVTAVASLLLVISALKLKRQALQTQV